jgi:hypothetical protein
MTDDIFREIFRECDGLAYNDYCHIKRHVCSGPGAWNHTLINRGKVRGVKISRAYFDKPINLSWNCQKFHSEYGETTKYREWFKQRQIWKYGRKAVKEFFDNSPQKIKERM